MGLGGSRYSRSATAWIDYYVRFVLLRGRQTCHVEGERGPGDKDSVKSVESPFLAFCSHVSD